MSGFRRSEGNPLDLNNLPEDFITRDGKPAFDESSSSGYRKKKIGGKDGKEECGKVYECRFCSLKFCKSQALGGHMNRHRQERETETLNRARQLVFGEDNLAASQAASHLGVQPSFHQTGDPFRSSIYSTRLFPPGQPQPPPQQPAYVYTSPSSRIVSYPTQYPPMNDYFVGHVLTNTTSSSQYGHFSNCLDSNNYTCIGAPVGTGFVPNGGGGSGRGGMMIDMGGISGGGGGGGGVGGGGGGGRDMSLHNSQHSSSTNRFQDGF